MFTIYATFAVACFSSVSKFFKTLATIDFVSRSPVFITSQINSVCDTFFSTFGLGSVFFTTVFCSGLTVVVFRVIIDSVFFGSPQSGK
jgi:hypothetical protein